MTFPHDIAAPAAPAPARSLARRAAIGAVALAALGGGAWFGARRWALREPEISGFWARSFPAPDGRMVALAPLRGRPLLVNFWATWCPPCVEELPLLSSFYAENKANGWQMLGLAVDRPESVVRFLDQSPVSFPVALAGMNGVALTRELGNAPGGLPFSVLFDASGRLRERKLGQLRAHDLAAWRDKLGAG